MFLHFLTADSTIFYYRRRRGRRGRGIRGIGVHAPTIQLLQLYTCSVDNDVSSEATRAQLLVFIRL
jgi:hypothetical protein